jgi:hypothetical protein
VLSIDRNHLPLLACVLVVACSRSGTDAASSEGQSESTETGVEEACECITVQGNDALSHEEPILPTCAAESCPVVQASSESEWGTTGGEGGSFVLDTPAALVCALEALRDRTPMLLRWDEDIDSGYSSDSGYVFIREDGLAVHRSRSWEDLGGWVSEAVLGELDSPEHYQACLDDPDELTRFECLRATLTTSVQICDQGWPISFD